MPSKRCMPKLPFFSSLLQRLLGRNAVGLTMNANCGENHASSLLLETLKSDEVRVYCEQ